MTDAHDLTHAQREAAAARAARLVAAQLERGIDSRQIQPGVAEST